MEDWWKRAKTFAEEAAKTSQTLAASAASSAASAKISDLISETAKKSRELALEASKKADDLKAAALQQADQIKSIAALPPPLLAGPSGNAAVAAGPETEEELEKLGVTGDLREFVKGFTPATFQNFPIRDDEEKEEEGDAAAAGSNVRRDLTEWQAKHATLVLTTVKEISRLRYQLCPRVMKERRFWRIYFTLVSTHVAPFEKRYLEDAKLKAVEQAKAEKMMQAPVAEIQNPNAVEKNAKSSTSSLSAQQDLDTFLLGDLEDSDGGADDGEGSFADDFDKIDNLDDEDEEDQQKPT